MSTSFKLAIVVVVAEKVGRGQKEKRETLSCDRDNKEYVHPQKNLSTKTRLVVETVPHYYCCPVVLLCTLYTPYYILVLNI